MALTLQPGLAAPGGKPIPLSIPPEKAGDISPEVLQLIDYGISRHPIWASSRKATPLTLADPNRPHDMDRTGGQELMDRHLALKPIPMGDVPPGTWD